MQRFATFVLSALALSSAAPTQGTRADYERAAELSRRWRGTVARSGIEPQWIGSGATFWYRVDLGAGRRGFVFVDPASGERRPLFDHERLAAALSSATGTPQQAERLPLERLATGEDGALRFAVGDRGFRWTADGQLEQDEAPAAREDRRAGRRRGGGGGLRDNVRARPQAASPDGQWTALVRDHEVWLRHASGAEVPLTTDSSAADGFGGEPLWSSDSKHFVMMRTKAGEDRTVHMVESTPDDQLQPKLHEMVYAKPGDVLPLRRPRLFSVASGAEVPVDEALFANPWSISGLRWDADGARLTFLYNQRGHQVLRVVAVDAATGAATALVDESPATFVDYAHKTFCWWLDAAGELIWMSERDGWNHLYLLDAGTGAVKRQLTAGPFVVRAVEHVDEEGRQLVIRVMGLHPGQDPYHQHIARVDLDSGAMTVLTEGDGTQTLSWSPDRSHFVTTWSRVDHPPVSELRRAADGALVCELERADWTALLEAGWPVPERFVAKGRDGSTDIWGVIWRPTNFDAQRRYPVIESIYAGPHDHHVPKAFTEFRGEQALCELGFVVVKIDGMGTNWRSKAFHDVAWKNLGDSGFPDRIAWMRAAATERPWMDLERVGIYGGSAGGQSALRALLAHGDFYDAAAADCGCHDNRMDKVWWNELWMSWPVGPHYAEQSNVTQAHRLQGHLLLTVGELDRNVDPASTMQVVDKLIEADKDFELIVFPSGGHGAGGGAYGVRRRNDFFVRHLLGLTPRAK
jgi:dipeptidyl aminopeptidase/acylaminoacyl peptidase